MTDYDQIMDLITSSKFTPKDSMPHPEVLDPYVRLIIKGVIIFYEQIFSFTIQG